LWYGGRRREGEGEKVTRRERDKKRKKGEERVLPLSSPRGHRKKPVSQDLLSSLIDGAGQF